MNSAWITGEEAGKEYGLVPIELGKACFAGELTAHCQAGWGPIYEASKLDRVPKYPPIGVDRMDHVRKGESVCWEWDDILGISTLQSEVQRIKVTLQEAFAVWKAKDSRPLLARHDSFLYCSPVDPATVRAFDLSPAPSANSAERRMPRIAPARPKNHFEDWTFEQVSELIQRLIKRYGTIDHEIRERKNVPIDAVCKAQDEALQIGLAEVDDYKHAWKIIMPIAYLWLVDGRPTENEDLRDRLFLFDFDMFLRAVKKKYEILKQELNIKQIGGAYEQQIKDMWFARVEVEALSLQQPLTPKEQDPVPLPPLEEEAGTHEVVDGQPTEDEREAAAQQWLRFSQKIRSSGGDHREWEAAQIAMHKWRGKKQENIFNMVFPDEKETKKGTKRTRITRYKPLIRDLVNKRSLPCPDWAKT